jgi:hypothetical protein
MSVGCAFESRRGHFLFSAFEPPWRGQVSSLRVLLAPGAFLLAAFEPHRGDNNQSVARFLLRRTGESRRGHEGTVSVNCAETLR